MTLSPELLAMIADVPAATDEEIADWSKVFPTNHYVYRLIARIVALEKKGS